MKSIKIVIADDHPIIRDGFKTILDLHDNFHVIGTASNGKEAIRYADQSPDVILMDVQMPVVNGLEATKQIKEKHPKICILMLTSHTNGPDVIEAISYGASGFLLKGWETERIITSIKEALNGSMQIPSSVATSITELLQAKRNSDATDETQGTKWDDLEIPLSSREKEIASLLVNGFRNEKIAKELFLSVGTIKNYVTSLYKKLGVRTRREAIVHLNKTIMKKSK